MNKSIKEMTISDLRQFATNTYRWHKQPHHVSFLEMVDLLEDKTNRIEKAQKILSQMNQLWAKQSNCAEINSFKNQVKYISTILGK